jgi:hypothetical protein
MVKTAAKKIYKPQRKEYKDSKDHIVFKFKNLTPTDIRELKQDLHQYLQAWIAQPEPTEGTADSLTR